MDSSGLLSSLLPVSSLNNKPSNEHNDPSPSPAPAPSSPPSPSNSQVPNESQVNTSTTHSEEHPSPQPTHSPANDDNKSNKPEKTLAPEPTPDTKTSKDDQSKQTPIDEESKHIQHKTVTTSSASAVIQTSTMDDGKVHTYTLTSFVPYTTTIPDDGVNSGNKNDKPSNATPIIAGTVVTAVIAASIVGLIVFCCMKRKRKQRMRQTITESSLLNTHDYTPTTSATPTLEASPRPLVAPHHSYYSAAPPHNHVQQPHYDMTYDNNGYDVYNGSGGGALLVSDRHLPDQADYHNNNNGYYGGHPYQSAQLAHQQFPTDVPHTKEH